MRSLELLRPVCSLLVVTAGLMLACGQDRDENPLTGDAGLDAGDATEDGEDGDDGESGDDETGDETGAADSGEPGVECGVPQPCEQPVPPADRGRASHAPYGCGGSATFALDWTWEAPGGGAKAVPVTGDVDGDGNVDILMNPRKRSVMLFRGAGDGSFGEPTALPNDGGLQCGWGPDLADVNNDGQLDVVLGDHCIGPRSWLNTGGSFAQSHAGLPDQPVSGCGSADLDGDGNLDIACGADQFSSGFNIAFGDGQGSWTAQSFTGIPAWEQNDGVPTNTGYFAFADYDKDGDLDIFASGQRGIGWMTVFVARNEGDGVTYTAVAQLDGGFSNQTGGVPVQGSIGDVNCDGFVDVAAGGAIYLGDQYGWVEGAVPSGSHLSHLGDIDGDGYLDLVVHSRNGGYTDPYLRLYLNDGSGTSWTLADSGLPEPGWIPPGWSEDDFVNPLIWAYGVDIVDLNNDGRLDILRWYEMYTNDGDVNRLEGWLQQ